MTKTTIRDIITEAYRKAGVVGIGDQLSALELQNGMTALRDIVEELHHEKLWTPFKEEVIFTPKAPAQEYTIGSLPGNALLYNIPSGFIASPIALYPQKDALDTSVMSYITDSGEKRIDAPVVDGAILRSIATAETDKIAEITLIEPLPNPELYIEFGESHSFVAGDTLFATDGFEFAFLLDVVNAGVTGVDCSVVESVTNFELNTAPLVLGSARVGYAMNQPAGDRLVIWKDDSDINSIPDIVTETFTPDSIAHLRYYSPAHRLETVYNASDDEYMSEQANTSQTSPSAYPELFRYVYAYPYGRIQLARSYSTSVRLHIEIARTIPAFNTPDEFVHIKPGYAGYLAAACAAEIAAQNGLSDAIWRRQASDRLIGIRRGNRLQNPGPVHIVPLGEDDDGMFYDWRAGEMRKRVGRRIH